MRCVVVKANAFELRREIMARMQLTPGSVAVLAENVLLLQQIEEDAALHRVLSVVKMRYSAHDAQIQECEVRAPGGIHLFNSPRAATEKRTLN